MNDTVFTCMVEMFGLPEDLACQSKIEISLKDRANLKDVVAMMRRKFPALEGPVIRVGKDQLLNQFGFYVNGHFYVGDEEIQLKKGDRVVLLALATGG